MTGKKGENGKIGKQIKNKGKEKNVLDMSGYLHTFGSKER